MRAFRISISGPSRNPYSVELNPQVSYRTVPGAGRVLIGCRYRFDVLEPDAVAPPQTDRLLLKYVVDDAPGHVNLNVVSSVLPEQHKCGCPDQIGMFLHNEGNGVAEFRVAFDHEGDRFRQRFPGVGPGQRRFLGCKFNPGAAKDVAKYEVHAWGSQNHPGFAPAEGDVDLLGVISKYLRYDNQCPLPKGSYPDTPTAIAFWPQRHGVFLRNALPATQKHTNRTIPPVWIRLVNEDKAFPLESQQEKFLGCDPDKYDRPQEYRIAAISQDRALVEAIVQPTLGELRKQVEVASFQGAGCGDRGSYGAFIANRNGEAVVVTFADGKTMIVSPTGTSMGKFVGCAAESSAYTVTSVTYWDE